MGRGLWARRPQAHPALRPADPRGWQASLRALSLAELAGALEDRVREMGESEPTPCPCPCPQPPGLAER